MKTNSILALLILQLVSYTALSQYNEGTISYSFVKDAAGKIVEFNLGGGLSSGLTFLGQDDKYVYAYTTQYSSNEDGMNIKLASFDSKSYKLIKTDNITHKINNQKAIIMDIYFFQRKILLASMIENKTSKKNEIFLQQLNGETFEAGGTLTKVMELDVKKKIKWSSLWSRISPDGNKLGLFLFPSQVKPESRAVLTSFIKPDISVEKAHEYILIGTAKKSSGVEDIKMNNSGESCIMISYTKFSLDSIYDIFFLYPSKTTFKRCPINNNGAALIIRNSFIVGDSLIYLVSKAYKSGYNGTYSTTCSGFFVGCYSMETGKQIKETIIKFTAKDITDLSEKSNALDKGVDDVKFHYCYNPYTNLFYAIYEKYELIASSNNTSTSYMNNSYERTGDILVKEYDLSFNLMSSFKFSRNKGEYPLVFVPTNTGTYIFADSKEKNSLYKNESAFQISIAKSDYYALKIKDGQMEAHGYGIRNSSGLSQHGLRSSNIELSENEILFPMINEAKFNLVKIKFN